MKAAVVNIRKELFDVYIGRAGRGQSGYFGNPFSIGAGVTREHAIESFRQYFYQRIENDREFSKRVEELRGKRLGCFCKPLACHGDVIVEWLSKMESGVQSERRSTHGNHR